MRSVAVTFILALCSLSCQSIDEAQKPEKFIPKEKMAQILYDVAVVNAARGYSVQKLKKNNVSPDVYVFEKHNIDSLQYTENTAYYSSNIDDYKDLYLEVEERIINLKDSLNTILEVEKKQEDSLKKIRNLESRKRDSLRKAKGDTLIEPKKKLQPFSTFSVKEVLRDSI